MNNAEPAGHVPPWTVGDRMRKARIYAGVTTDEMADDIGRTRHTISNYERDVTTAPLLVLRQYAMRTQVPIEWIQHGIGAPPAPTEPATARYPQPLTLVA